MRDSSGGSAGLSRLRERLETLGLDGAHADWADRYLVCEHLIDPRLASKRRRFDALAHFVRDLLADRWVQTRRAREAADPKRVYYLSMEFLIGRTLHSNILNLMADPLVASVLEGQGWKLEDLLPQEPDAGLGNGGLGRLAACFIDSLATMEYSAIGYGLRYEYGIFRQSIRNGYQVEEPDWWLRNPDPWEIPRAGKRYAVNLNASIELQGSKILLHPNRPSKLIGVAYDRPVVGYGGNCVNTLRLWAAAAPSSFDFAEFSQGDFVGAVIDNIEAESLTRVLYPDDSTEAGRTLRFLQQYFLVSCSLQDIVMRFRSKSGPGWATLPERAAIQLNDTHPAISVAELMRILLDDAKLGWDEAWDLTRRTLAYTNHTLLPEALETWPVKLLEDLVPRHLEIIYEVNRRLLADVGARFPGDDDRARRMSLIQETPSKRVRMAHLAVVGTHATNGVAEIHSRLLRTRLLPDFAEMFPERFQNKTNGVTPRRWLRMANPGLARRITERIGEGWVTDLGRLRDLLPLAEDAGFRAEFQGAKREAKERFAAWLRSATGQTVDVDSIFDCQIKRIHEYKRQLLNVLHIAMLYNRLRRDPGLAGPKRTFLFAGKAAPAYRFAKRIIKLIHALAARVDADPAARGRLSVLFLPEYNVTLAERLIPAADVSEQISTAGYEASGTSNMKFMMNGALTIGTRDGATIEMASEAGEDAFFLFGLTAEQVAESRGWYDPRWHYTHEPEVREAVDLLFSGELSPGEPGVFDEVRRELLDAGDPYMHLADLTAYAAAQERVATLFANPERWTRMAIRNVATSGKFSSDRTITEYAGEIWNARPCPVAPAGPGLSRSRGPGGPG